MCIRDSYKSEGVAARLHFDDGRHYGQRKSTEDVYKRQYFGNVKKDVFLSRARNYSSCLERALDGEDVNVVVYKNLLDSVDASLPSMHRYIRDRKKIMKLDEQHMYDI